MNNHDISGDYSNHRNMQNSDLSIGPPENLGCFVHLYHVSYFLKSLPHEDVVEDPEEANAEY